MQSSSSRVCEATVLLLARNGQHYYIYDDFDMARNMLEEYNKSGTHCSLGRYGLMLMESDKGISLPKYFTGTS